MALLDVITSSTDAQLTTTSAVKLVLGVSATSDDGLIDALITRASAWAEQVVGYPLSAQAYLELLPGYGTRRLMVARTPIRAVTGLFNGTDSGDYTEVDTTEFSVDREAGFLERAVGWEWDVPVQEGDLSLWPEGGQEYPDWRVEYVAGWTYAGISTASALYSTVHGTTATGRTLPYDIEQAVITKVITFYHRSEGVIRRRVGDLDVAYDPVGEDPALSLLKPYRRSA